MAVRGGQSSVNCWLVESTLEMIFHVIYFLVLLPAQEHPNFLSQILTSVYPNQPFVKGHNCHKYPLERSWSRPKTILRCLLIFVSFTYNASFTLIAPNTNCVQYSSPMLSHFSSGLPVNTRTGPYLILSYRRASDNIAMSKARQDWPRYYLLNSMNLSRPRYVVVFELLLVNLHMLLSF